MKKIFSISLSFFLLASQINLVIGTHFCGGEAVETKLMLGETHLGCGMPDMKESCDASEKSNNQYIGFNKIPCCENKYQYLQVTDEFVKDAAQLSFKVDFAIALIYPTLNSDLLPKSTHQFYLNYSPPALEKDLQIIFQTFLI
ncbi:MAG: hypothetical protein R6W78_10910 [Bacteroidales bacterium]